MELDLPQKTEIVRYSVDIKVQYNCTKIQRKYLMENIKKHGIFDCIGAGPDGWYQTDVIKKSVRLKKVNQKKKK